MESKDDKLRDLLKLSKVDLPFEDFDERVLGEIQRIAHDKHTIRAYKRNATVFFIVGTIFGFGMNYLLTEFLLNMELKEPLKNSFLLGSQIVYVLPIILFSSALNKFIKWRKERV